MVAQFSPYSSIARFHRGGEVLGFGNWYPGEEVARVQAYEKYDEIYWNDDTQFVLRVLEGEQPLYIPNARTIVDTTSYYLLKGLRIQLEDPERDSECNTALTNFLKRELFYSRFHTAKHAGVARGDFVLHMTADPRKDAGERLSLNSVDPSMVIPIYDPDDASKMIRVHIVDMYDTTDSTAEKRIRKLTYEYETVGGRKRVKRSEGIYKLNEKWWGNEPELVQVTIPEGLLPPGITVIPVYWFKNIEWEGQLYGSSELRGFEGLLQGVSQASSDQEAALGLEGLGVYATDGGRPVNESGNEVDWEVAPGKVMEVPTGSYFRRVEGLSSLKPSMDHINYLESKLREAGGLSDVALGRVDVQTAQSGIALAIKFIPTLAKIEQRDTAGIGKLEQLFHDWKAWYIAYEGKNFGEIEIQAVIGDKLPEDRTATINELNNMLDRSIISMKYYRTKMQELGYTFPDDMEQQIDAENTKKLEQAQKAMQATQPAQGDGEIPPPPGKGGNGTLPPKPNQSNNSKKPNESAGTESGQTLKRQAHGGKP